MQEAYLSETEERKRLKVTVRGAVQGVGFRPFVYRLATELDTSGWVLNSSQGVFIEIEGTDEHLNSFLLRLEREKPPRAIIQSLEFCFLDPVGFSSFEIRKSEEKGEKTALVLPEIATCGDCTQDVLDPSNRRFLYPFTNCTNCGPRFSIIEALPYDRPSTSMKIFEMCPDCRKEYENPLDRRFHAQPNACSECGPSIELWQNDGVCTAREYEALTQSSQAVREGKILALKSIGGFQLIANALHKSPVEKLRTRKNREEKPFAVMFPSLDMVKKYCQVSELEERLLLSPESPIVLLSKRKDTKVRVAANVAPENPYLGVMLPYTPLHQMLMKELGFPVVATSGNLTDEPIVTNEQESLKRLKGIPDLFLVHNRPIVRHVDDSVVRVILGKELVLRRARGYAPLPVSIPTVWANLGSPMPKILALGAHLKNTVAISQKGKVFISQHIGNLETVEAHRAFRTVIGDFKSLYGFEPEAVACDMHPEYLSTKYAKSMGLPVLEVQHHHAHVAACMAENELEGPVLGVSWDGTGYGTDGTVWGGEFLLSDFATFRRVCHFRTFRLPGGDRAVREPRRSALGMLYEIFGDEVSRAIGEAKSIFPLREALSDQELKIFVQMMGKSMNSPLTSSVGRIFDAVSSLSGLRQRVSFEGQAEIELEYAANNEVESFYPFEIAEKEPGMTSIPNSRSYVVDWHPMILAVLKDIEENVSTEETSTKFHNTLSEIIIRVANLFDTEKIVLTGGVFQNKYLTERTWKRLEEEGFKPYVHQRLPPNDGGISFGQAVVAAARLTSQDS